MDHRVEQHVAAVAEGSHGVFAMHHLRELGISRRQREQRIVLGVWIEIHEGTYRIAGAPPSWRGNLVAACWAGIPVTTVERTIFDLLAVCSRKTVDYALDNALRRELTTLDKLAAMLRRVGRRGLKGTRSLRALLAERDARYTPTESERENMMIDALRAHDPPEPVRQFEVYDEFGVFVARVDLAYPDLMITIDYDSYQEHIGKQQLVRDSRRRNAIAAVGYCTLVATAEDVRFGQGHALGSAVKRARTRVVDRRAAA